MTVQQAVKQNKFISVIIGAIATALLAWGIWVTEASYKVHYVRQVASEKRDVEIKGLCVDIDELKSTDRVVAQEVKELREKIHVNQEKMILMLFEIKKEVRGY